MGIIYLATNKINGKQYIGQTIHTLTYRKWQHENLHKPGLGQAIDKYGKENFEWKVISSCRDEYLDWIERYWIFALGTRVPNGYNRDDGGGKTWDEVNRMKYASPRKKPEEEKKRIFEKQKGIPRPQTSREFNGSAKKIYRISDNKLYGCIEDCAAENDMHPKTIRFHCQNKVKKPKFKYA